MAGVFVALNVDRTTWIALTLAALVPTLIAYFGASSTLVELLAGQGWFAWLRVHEPALYEFYRRLWWIGFGVLAYLGLPALVIWVSGARLREYGVKLPSDYRHLWIYGGLLAAVVPIAWWASYQDSFLAVYPYFDHWHEAPWLFALFWIGRIVRFFALEFFFRGYLIFALRPRFGDAAVLVSMVPYCMIHFGKPLPETLFAIVGGIIFGMIALRTGSILGAVVLHVGLAASMDAFAIAQRLGWL